MSTNEDLEIADKTSTISSLAELRHRLLTDETLPDRRRADMASALTSLAKVLGQPAETLPAAPVALRSRLAGITPAMVGLKPGRWRNVVSLATAALAHAGIVAVQGRINAPPSPAWTALLPQITAGAGRHFHLWRFARYCTQMAIEPAAVDDAVLAQYQRDLETRSLVAEPARAAREAARFWNQVAGTVPGWPQQRLAVPDNRRGFAPPWEAFPESLRRDVAAWCEWLGGTDRTDPFDDERTFSPLRPKSVETRRRQLKSYLGALIVRGTKLEELVDLASAVTPARARQALLFFWDKAGKKPTVHIHQMISLVVMIAKHWGKLPTSDIERLQKMAKQLPPVATGMSSRNKARLRQFEDEGLLDALLGLPALLSEKARRMGAPSVHAALLVQAAVAVDLLTLVPARFVNHRELRIGVTLVRGSGGNMFIAIPGHEVKNSQDEDGRLPTDTVRLIDTYLARYRPLLAQEGTDWLFPGAKAGAPKSDDGLRSQIVKAIANYAGLKMTPHLFRLLVGWLILRENPAAHGQVQRLLRHKSIYTTMNYYSGLEAAIARDHYDAQITARRAAPVSVPSARRKKAVA